MPKKRKEVPLEVKSYHQILPVEMCKREREVAELLLQW
jgi:hypothetical protein